MRFKTLEEFDKFCDTSMWCVCGQLMTGLHMSHCWKLKRIRNSIMIRKEKEAMSKYIAVKKKIDKIKGEKK